jgi:DNA mismatch endonuclease (patch repair protein)
MGGRGYCRSHTNVGHLLCQFDKAKERARFFDDYRSIRYFARFLKLNRRMRRLDPLTRIERSERMSRVRDRDTKPEIRVRKALFALGYRFRLHSRLLPGRPDIVFPSRKKAILIHGCFWHLHQPCTHYRFPLTRVKFWREKLIKNRLRDARVAKELKKAGWRSFIVWECELKNFDLLIKRIERFLEK